MSAAGEVVPAFGVLEAVGNGVAEMGHTASFYWQGKMAAATFFTTVPFGLTPAEHVAWIEAGGGQARGTSSTQPFGVEAVHGRQHRRLHGRLVPPRAQESRRSTRAQAALLGLGGEVYRRLGATPQTTPPAEILTRCNPASSTAPNSSAPAPTSRSASIALRRSTITPASTKPNGTGECIVSLKAWEQLAPDLKAIVAHACAAEANFALAEMERLNAQALAALINDHGVKLHRVPGRSGRRRAQDLGRCARRTPVAATLLARACMTATRTSARGCRPGRGCRSRRCSGPG